MPIPGPNWRFSPENNAAPIESWVTKLRGVRYRTDVRIEVTSD